MLNATTAKALLETGRRVFSETEKDDALKYHIEQQCTVTQAAEQFGMSTQTLAIHKRKNLEAHGLLTPKAAKPRKKAKKA